MDRTTLETLTQTISQIPGVVSVNLWTKIPGKERIYVDLSKHNGGANWNSGIGHRVVVNADGSAGLDERADWAGAATRNWHSENDTVAKIYAAIEAVE